jgi:hypothetical protein
MSRYRSRVIIFVLFCLLIAASGIFQISCKSEPSPVPTPSPEQSPKPTTPTPEPTSSPVPQDTLTQPEQDDEHSDDFIERHIVVDARNNVFGIGVPAGIKEETEVIAAEPIDFWFQYLPEEVLLEVDDIPVQRSGRWEFKIRETTDAMHFKYVVKNPTSEYASYNLHLVPAIEGHAVEVTVIQRWIKLEPDEK